MVDATILIGTAMILSFVVNIVVQITKNFIPMPTKLWCIIVALAVNMGTLLVLWSAEKVKLNTALFVVAGVGSFFTAFIAMYGFDTLKDLWERFKKGENINEDGNGKKL